MKRFLPAFTAFSAFILAIGCTQPQANPPADTTAPAPVEVQGFGGGAAGLRKNGTLDADAQDKLRAGSFTISYKFAPGKWKDGVEAFLFLGSDGIAEAEPTTRTKATFDALSGDLLAGGKDLVLKFKEASGDQVADAVLLKGQSSTDTTPPTIQLASRTGTTLTLTLSEPLSQRDASTGPGGFTLAGTTETVTRIAAVVADATTVVLTLSGAPGTATVTLTYTKPSDPAKQIRDRADNPLANVTEPVSVGRPDGTPPPQPESVTTITGGADGNAALSNQAGADKVLKKADEAALKAHQFTINYTFAAGTPFKAGSVAVLYQGTAKIAEAATTEAAAAEFAALGETSLTSGQSLTLKFKDAAGNESKGIKAADVDTAAPAAPTAVTIEDVNPTATPADTTISLPDISGASNGDSAGIDLGFTAAAALASGDKVTVAGFGASDSKKEFTGAEIKTGTGTGTNAYKVTIAAADITDGQKSITVKVTDAAGNEGGSSTAVTLTVEITAPTITNAALNGTALTLTMSEALASRGESTGTGGFTLTGATGIFVASIAAVTGETRTVVLTLSAAPATDATVSLTYTKPSAEAEQIRDKAGNPLAAFTESLNVEQRDKSAPPEPESVTAITGAAGSAALSNQAGADKVLNKADEEALKAHRFRIDYTFAAGTPFKTGSVAVLYQGTATIAEAATTEATGAEFAALGETSLTSGTPLTLKFKDAAGNESKGIKAADVDTAAPAAPTAVTIEDIDATATPADTVINLPDIIGASNGDSAGIDLGFTAAAALESGDRVTVASFGASGSKKEFTGTGIKPGTGTNVYKVTMAAADITDGAKSITVKVTDAAGNEGGSSTSVTLTVEATAPTIDKAEITGGKALTLTMSEALGPLSTITGNGGFILAGTTNLTVQRVSVPAGTSPTKVILTLDKSAQTGDRVTLTYAQPSTEAEKIKDKAGNALASITTDDAVSVNVVFGFEDGDILH